MERGRAGEQPAGEERGAGSPREPLATLLPHPEANPLSFFKPDERLVSLHRTNTVWHEQYQKLRLKLSGRFREMGVSPKVLLVTSALPGEGKSLTAVNLSLNLQRAGSQRVLLVEADLRKPRIRDLLHRPPHQGLGEVLNGEVSLEKVLGEFRGSGYQVLLGGAPVQDPPQLLESERWDETLAQVRESFDFVIIDTPPSVPFPDVSILSKHVDGILVVVRMGVTPKDMVLNCLQNLDRGKVVGIVANGVQESETHKYYDYYRHE